MSCDDCHNTNLSCPIVFQYCVSMDEKRRLLAQAIKEGNVEDVIDVLDKGADLNITFNRYFAPLHTACEYGHTTIVAALIDRGADLHAVGMYGKKPIHMACRNGHTEVIKTLIEKGAGADVDHCDHNGNSPLHVAIKTRNTETALALIDCGADVNVNAGYSQDPGTPLHHACFRGLFSVVMALIERGADIHSRDHRQQTPLHRANSMNHTDVAIALIKRGADIRAAEFPDPRLITLFDRLWDFSPLMHALYMNDVSSFRNLLEAYDESSDVSSVDGWGVLHAGVYLDRRECVVLYMQSEHVPIRKKLASTGAHSCTGLHIACSSGNMAMLEAIMEQI